MQSLVVPIAEPLYEQVHRILRTRILKGEWKPQALLPGEVVLSQELRVSVGTVRKAMDQLARENLVMRERGRGTFVKGDDEWQSKTAIRFFDLGGRPIVPSIELLEASLVVATPSELKELKIGSLAGRTPELIKIRRQWTSDQTLLSLETITVEASRFPNLSRDSTTEAETLHAYYAQNGRARVERTVWQIGHPVSAMSAADCALPRAQASASDVLLLNRLALDARGMPIELCRHEIQLRNCGIQLSA